MQKSLIALLCALSCLFCLAFPFPGIAATYYVATTGNNSNDGSSGSPWLTIQHAANTAVAGDTVNIGAGTYYERLTFPNSGSGTGNRITFNGTRGGGGSWNTIVDGTTAVGATWVAAPEVGSGVYKATLGYTPRFMSANNLGIWMIGDRQMNGEDRGAETGFQALAHPPDDIVETYINFGDFGSEVPALTPYWYGIGALFGTTAGGTTYLRFRYEESPATMGVRAAPSGATIDINAKNYLTFSNLKVQGGQWAVYVHGGSTGIIMDQSYVAHGQFGFVDDGINTQLTNSTITYDGIGITFAPGDWSDATADRIAHRHQYNLNKFLIGDTDVDDKRVLVGGSSSGFIIANNTIFNSLQGIVFMGTPSGTDIHHNIIYQMSDNCFYYIHNSTVNINIHHNTVYDCDHIMRFENTENQIDVNVYANRFYQVWYATGFRPKHLFVSTRGTYHGSSDLQIYHNTFAGAGNPIDGSDDFPFVHARNNMMAVDGYNLSGGGSFGTFTNNLEPETDPWPYNPMPTFVLPPGDPGIDTAPSLISLGLPGMDTAYYVDGLPDHGAIQAGVIGDDTIDPVVAITAPASRALVASATVLLTANATDNVGVVGVQFKLDGNNLGAEDTTSTYGITWDTTATTNGNHTLTAIARDAASNTATSSAITVIVLNNPTSVSITAAGTPAFPANPTSVSISAGAVPPTIGNPTSVSITAAGTPIFLANPSSVSITAADTPIFLANPSSVGITVP